MIPHSRPVLGLPEVVSALASSGTRSQFEAAVAQRVGARFAVAFAYAHSAFLALLRSQSLVGAEIILPAYTCDIMSKVVLATGNIPVFVDIDLADYNMDLGALHRAITDRTRVIVATHMFGYPASVRAIREIADSSQISIVEDAALTFPGSTTGVDGLQADASLFSFGPGKPLFTLRGGVLVTNDVDLYDRLVSFRDKEMSPLPAREWAKRWALLAIHYFRSRDAGYDLMCHLHLSKQSINSLAAHPGGVQLGSNPESLLPGDYATRYADFQARMGLAQLRKAGAIHAYRQAQARLYRELLSGIPGVVPAPIVEGASYGFYTVRVRNRDAIGFRHKMWEQGIQTGRNFNYALPSLPENLPYCRGVYPAADQASREIANLPAYVGLTEAQSGMVARKIREILSDQVRTEPHALQREECPL